MNAKASTDAPCCDVGATLGFLTLRLWLAVRAIFTGIEKFAGTATSDSLVSIEGAENTYGLTEASTQKVYGWSHNHGVPDALYGKLADEPLLPDFALKFFDAALGPMLIFLGVTLLLGICTRISLFAMGLIYVGLTVGLILLKQDAGIALALFNAKHNRLELFRKF